MMKILIVNKFLYPNGGSETYIFKVGDQLKKMGHEVQYFGMEHEDRIVENHSGCYTTNMDFHTGKLQKLLYPFRIIYSKEARKKIRVVLEDFKPDVIHLNNFNFQLTPSILYEIRKYKKDTSHDVRTVFTAHDSQLVCPNHLMQRFLTGERCTSCIGGSPWNCTKYKCIHGSRAKSALGSLEAWIYRMLKTYRLIDTVICPSDFIKVKLDSSPVLRGKTVVLHNFVDRIEDSDKKLLKERYVLYFGRFSEEKGIGTLLRAVKRLPQIPFIFVGNGPLEAEVDSLSNITNKGFLSGDTLREEIAGASFSVFTSECYENCPFSVMESITYGTPVIGADIGGTSELIRDGVTGELFESGNEEQLYGKILNFWEDECKVKRYTEACTQENFFTTEEYCEKLLTFYKCEEIF